MLTFPLLGFETFYDTMYMYIFKKCFLTVLSGYDSYGHVTMVIISLPRRLSVYPLLIFSLEKRKAIFRHNISLIEKGCHQRKEMIIKKKKTPIKNVCICITLTH